MAKAQTSLQNYAGGELGASMRSRFDLPIYQHGFEICRNFIIQIQGPAKFRPGLRYVRTTRRNKLACLIKFQFSNEQAYELEFTDGYMRVYKDNGIVLETAKTITGATQANPCVVTSASHGFTNGQEVYISGVKGMKQLNGKYYLVANAATNTFELTDQDGGNVDATAFGAYTSGGTVSRVYEIQTPYLEADDLFLLRFAQNADTMYMVHPYYEPRKLTRSGHTSWALNLFSRTADPFLDKKTITAVTNANPCKVTAVGHGYSTGETVIIEGVVGTTQINSRHYTITVVDADNFTLDGINSTAYGVYVSGGYASKTKLLPAAVTFIEGRLGYSVIKNEPLSFKLSRAPDNGGATRYDDFTNGTNDDHAVEYTINAEDESAAQWLRGNDKFLAIGAFGGVYKVTGNTDQDAISPTSVNVRRVTSVGSSRVNPISLENAIIYSEQHNLTVRSFEYDALLDTFKAVDRNIINDGITRNGIAQFAFQNSRPEVLWVRKSDGSLLGLSFQSGENVSAWHRHPTRYGDDFEAISSVPRSENFERLWVVVQRTIDGVMRRYVEYLEDFSVFPDPEDYYTGDESEDKETFLRAMWEAQKQAVHVDSAVSYDGSDPSIAAAAITPAAVSGDSVLFTADSAIFEAENVGRQIWKKPIDGVGTGRAEIVEYVSATQVRCNILEEFDSASSMAIGDWYLTTDQISNLGHLEGETVHIITDGAVHPDRTVAGETAQLQYQSSVVHVGLKYLGMLKTMNLEVGGINGPSQTKMKNLEALGIRFYQTLGAKFGTSLYELDEIEFRSAEDYTDRPPPLFSGDKKLPYEDSAERNKNILIVQSYGLPCTVQLLQPYVQTKNS